MPPSGAFTGPAAGGLAPGSIVIVHLAQPTEKFWGALVALDGVGITVRGIGLESFDEWVGEVARDEPPSLGLTVMFAPLFRLERVFLDERVGAVESYRDRFATRVGVSAERYLGLDSGAPEVPS